MVSRQFILKLPVFGVCNSSVFHLLHFALQNFEFPHFFQKLNHLQNKKAKTLH